MRYEPIEPVSRRDAEEAFRSGERDAVVHALIGLALHDDDWPWVQRKCMDLSTSEDVWVQRACATALLHIAREHRQLNMDQAMAVFRRLFENPEIAGEAQETLDEIQIFLRNSGNG